MQLGLEEENVDMWHFTVRVGLKEEKKEENVGREWKCLKEESLRVSERKRISVEEF